MHFISFFFILFQHFRPLNNVSLNNSVHWIMFHWIIPSIECFRCPHLPTSFHVCSPIYPPLWWKPDDPLRVPQKRSFSLVDPFEGHPAFANQSSNVAWRNLGRELTSNCSVKIEDGELWQVGHSPREKLWQIITERSVSQHKIIL